MGKEYHNNPITRKSEDPFEQHNSMKPKLYSYIGSLTVLAKSELAPLAGSALPTSTTEIYLISVDEDKEIK